MIGIFKTDVQQPGTANLLISKLMLLFPGARVSFDLDDCDRVLRVEGQNICCETIVRLVKSSGCSCEELA